MDILNSIRELRAKGKKGIEIAKILLQKGCSIEEAKEAFFKEGYVVFVQLFTLDIKELHVSDNPMGAGISVIILNSQSRVLPSIVWTVIL
ncbi:MAG TPA: hypothetical protein ENH26_02760 [Candidatus Wolfebacteria bacterium]|nr:hypothetical protein [Candidatus Wolfebacteria bacterium]